MPRQGRDATPDRLGRADRRRLTSSGSGASGGPSRGVTHSAYAGVHAGIGADRHGGHHCRPSGASLLARGDAHRRVDGGRENAAQALGTRRAARKTKLRGQVAHRFVAIARSKRQSLDDRAHEIGVAMVHRQADEACARIRVRERPALTRFGNVREVNDLAGTARRQPSFDALHQIAMADFGVGSPSGCPPPDQAPNRCSATCRHIGLHLHDKAGRGRAMTYPGPSLFRRTSSTGTLRMWTPVEPMMEHVTPGSAATGRRRRAPS